MASTPSPLPTPDFSDPSTCRTDAPASQLFEEKTWLQGAILSAVAYGVVVTLFFLNLSLLLDRVRHETKQSRFRRRQSLALLIYICVMFVLSTLTMASQAKMSQLGFIENRNFPGGPAAFHNLMFSIPISTLGNVCFSLMNWFSDCVLLWRCLVIYRATSARLMAIMAFPTIMMLASFITGIVYLQQISRPGSSPWASQIFTIIYGLISLSLNVVLTIMIVVRLYLHRRQVVKAIGTRHGSQYTSIMAMLVESAFVLDVIAVFFIITFATGSPLANILLSTLVQVQTIASFMIIFRVATGTAWASTTVGELLTQDVAKRMAELSAIRFGRSDVDTTTAVSGQTHQETSHVEIKSTTIDIELGKATLSHKGDS